MDRAELTAAPNLSDSIRGAIARSECLIVVCSPDAAKSRWVDREITYFRTVRPAAPILPALCRGDPAEAFPPALLANGGEPPIAADFRSEGDGARLALLKLVAPLARQSLDQLVRRDAERGRRRVMTFTSAAALGGSICVLGAVLLFDARSRAASERARGEQMIDRMLGEERDKLKAVGRLDLLKDLNDDAGRYFQGRARGQLTDTEEALRAQLLWAMAEDDLSRSDHQAAEAKARGALAITSNLLKRAPNSPDRIRAQGQSEFWLGYARYRLNDAVSAEAAFTAYAALARRLVEIEGANPDARLERAYALSNLATLVLERSIDTARAGPLFAAAQRDHEAAAEARPADPSLQIGLADADAWLAEIRRFQGDYGGALNYRTAQRTVIERLLATDPRDARARHALMTNELAVGRLETARGDRPSAARAFAAAREDAAALAANDPSDDAVAQELRVIDLFEAEGLLSSPKAAAKSGRITALVGDCAPEARRPSREELAAFCEILQARLQRLEGKPSAASALKARDDAGALEARGALSERWLIDWRRELAN